VDSITHVLVGALIGEACGGKSLVKQGMILGAAAQSLPDIDFLASLWLDPADNLLAHRGITHSLLFATCATISLAFLFARRRGPNYLVFSKWVLFFGIEIFSHLFLDAFNNYGVGWFEPFDHSRISFNALFVADPFFAIWPGIACVVLICLRRESALRIWFVRCGLITCVFYLAFALFNKASIDPVVKENLRRQKIDCDRYFTTPTPFNNWLWYVVAEDSRGYYIGYRSVLDKSSSIDFQYFPRQDSLLNRFRQREDVRKLLQFSQGYYTVQHEGDTLVFNDLRFGQMAGWAHPQAGFVFHYYVNLPAENLLVVQRGRFADWNEENIRSLVRRIGGN
jgi:inner membrane protein